jgi:pyridoxamine 5'-phosphate oxidase
VPTDPLPTILEWLAAVTSAGKRRNPNAMALASTDSAGRPSVRMVLLKELHPAGYAVFYTNYGSRKARELEHNARGAAVLYWEDLGRQVRFEGSITRSPEAESNAYFASRPRRSQVNAWASDQSRPLADPAELEARAAEVAARPSDPATGALPRPRHWGGYRLWLDSVELWAEGEDRFHERLLYTRELTRPGAVDVRAGPWTWRRLQP